jgi:YHS domain-containing protein
MRRFPPIAAALMMVGVSSASGSSARELKVPEAFAPFEYLIGGWKGTEVPTADRLKGGEVEHAWAWKFNKGKVEGLSATFTGSKLLAKGELTYDESKKRYDLRATDPEGKPIAYAGALDPGGKMLVLKREGLDGVGNEGQLTLRLNDNQIRYTLWFDSKKPKVARYARAYESGLTKEGESFASGANANALPKCIITGGSAALTVSHAGRTYPVCCTGCVAEFEADPEKYVKLAAMKAEPAGAAPKAAPAPVAEPKAKGTDPASKKKGESAKKKAEPKKADDPAAKAKSALRLGQALERQGNKAGAVSYYEKVVADYPDAPEAKVAAERLKALGND